jgi:putative ABC transport system substrate-binding protein
VNTRRRIVIAFGASALAVPLGSLAQKPGKVWRIGFLGSETAAGYAKQIDAMRGGLREYGFIEGKNLAIEFRWADGNEHRLPELATELARLKPDILITHGGRGTRAAKGATSQIPIVIASISSDPAETGIVASLARPGENITGRVSLSTLLQAKQMELIKEVSPNARKTALLYQYRSQFETATKLMEEAARKLRLEIQLVGVRGLNEFDAAFATMAAERIDAAVVYNSGLFIANAARLATAAIKQRIPLVGNQEFAQAGALLGYGASILDNFRRVGYFVDRIAKGANPATMPIEQPTTFELVLNMKTAKTLGITFPPSVLVRAERVIQ